jgi:hypothetical protein
MVKTAICSRFCWAEVNKMSVNPKKTKDMWICFKQSTPEPPHLQINRATVERPGQ